MQPQHSFASDLSKLDLDSAYYRRVVSGCSGAFLLVALALLAWIAPRRYRRLNERTKHAAMAHLALAVCSSLVCLAAAALGLLGRQWVYALLSTFLAGTQGVDGVYTRERCRLTHPDYHPSWLVRWTVAAYIAM